MKQRFLLDYLINSLSLDMSEARLMMPKFDVERRPEEIWKQKVFCVLSSQFNADRAAAIANCIVDIVPFFDSALPLHRIEEACFEFLSSPLARHRFPKVKARHISLCWFPFAQVKDEYYEYICSFRSEHKARQEIVERFPGIGFKQASMFLRNIGFSKDLCVVDVHILFYLRVCHNWDVEQLTPKRYLEAEDILRNDAAYYGLDLNVFDSVAWSAARALKKASVHV